MRKIIFALSLLCGMAVAQTTPNLGLNIPPTGAPNWGVLLNANFTKLDTDLACFGTIPIPGTFVYFNGAAWVCFPGNNTGTAFFQENSVGVGSWVTAVGTGTVTSVSGLNPLFTVANPTSTPTFSLINAAGNTVFANCTGILAAPSFCAITNGMLPSVVPTSVANDTNVTGSIAGQILSLGWTGTLAAGRLNANVVQSIVNDTNVMGTISAQALTLGWTGTLAKGRNLATAVYTDQSNTWSTGTQSFAAATHTLPAVSGVAASKPGTCTAGEVYFATDATPGQNLYECTSGNTWTQQLNTGGGGIAFTSLLSGTNTTAAMLVGSGSSLGATGTGTISATALNGTAFTGTNGHLVSFGAANIPADSGVVAANVVTSSSPGVGIAHFAGSTQAVTSSAVNLAGADVTGNLPVTNLNSGTSASSSTFWRGDGSWATPAGSGTVNAATQFSGVYYSAAGSATTVSGVAGPTTPNSVPQFWIDTPSAGAATTPTWSLAGVPVDATNPATLLVTDRANYINWTSGTALALPAVATTFASNLPFVIQNTSTTLTITPNAGASDLIDGASSGTLIPKFAAFVYQDSTTAPGHWFTIKLPTFAAFGSNCGDGTHALNWSTTTGIGCQTVNGAPALSAVTGSAAQATGTEVGAGDEYTFAGVETANLTAPFSFTDANSTNNNTNGAVIIGTTGTGTGMVPLRTNQPTTDVGDIYDAYTGGTVTNGVLSGGTNVFSILANGSVQNKGTTAGFVALTQGTTSASVAPCNAANTHCIQAGTATTAGVETDAPALAQGIPTRVGNSAAVTDAYSGDTNHSATVTTGSGTSVGSTSLCSTTFCPAGTYRVSVYLDVTTACTTTGSYLVNVIYTDDTTVSKTTPIPIDGTGVTFATSTLALASTTNYGTGSFILRSTGAASINYSTTAGACGTGGPMVGKMYLTVEPLM